MLGDIWIPVGSGDPRAYGLFTRHYSFGNHSFMGKHRTKLRKFAAPGEYLGIDDARTKCALVVG